MWHLVWYDGVIVWYDGVIVWYDGVIVWHDGVIVWYDDVIVWYDGVIVCYDGVIVWYDGVIVWYDGVIVWYDGVTVWYDGVIVWYDGVMPGIKFRWGWDFLHPSTPTLGPTQTPVQWVPGLFSWVKRPGRAMDHPSPSSVEVKERVELHQTTPSGPSWPILGWTLPFTPMGNFVLGPVDLLRNGIS